MKNKETDRFIYEVMGNCCHVPCTADDFLVKCGKCGLIYEPEGKNDTYPTYLEHNKHWGELLNWVMKQEWWSDFEQMHLMNPCWNDDHEATINMERFANPRSLAEHIVEYLKERDRD